jgi:hypothetical protein
MKGWRKCKNCGVSFEKKQPLQSVCNFQCAIDHSKKLTEKKKSKEWRVKKAELKEQVASLSDYKKLLQVVINKIAREIDFCQPCISCGNPEPKKKNAGHYHSVGANPSVRFNLMNIYLQCEHCNSYLSGNLINYSKNFQETFGVDLFEYINFGIIAENPILKANKQELKEAIKRAKEFNKTLTNERLDKGDRIALRIAANKFIGLY